MLDFVPDLGQIRAEERRRSLLEFTADLVPNYEPGWVHREVAWALEQFGQDLVAGREPRLMIFMPPRVGKSTLATVAFPAWFMGLHPGHNFIQGAYGQDLSRKLSRRCRSLFRDRLYQETFPDARLALDSTSVEEWETRTQGGYKAVGAGSAVTGHGGHLLLDDTVKNRQEAYSASQREKVWDWYCWDLESRLPPGGGVCLVQTRWHHDDLPGRLLERDGRVGDGGDWRVVCFPAVAEADEYADDGRLLRREGEALHPERYPADCAMYRKARRNHLVWSALYQQRPSPPEGNLIKTGSFRRYTDATLPRHFDRVVLSVDCKFKETTSGSHVVIQAWGQVGANCYLLHQVRGRWGFVETIENLLQMRARFGEVETLIEEKANGSAVLEVLRDRIPMLLAVNPRESKQARCVAITPAIEAGNVWVPTSAEWLEDFLEECAAFPLHATDDQVDAMTQALAHTIINNTSLDWLTEWMGV